MYRLVIAEKPSVSQSLARVLGAYKRENGYLEGGGYLVSWCLGHLAEYVMPEAYDEKYSKWNYADLPIVPEEWKLSVAADKEEQFQVLCGLLNRNDVSEVVNACDAGREGELIFKRVYDLSGSSLPVKRLWISSMEDSAIQDGFAHLKDGEEYRNLCDAAVCRAKADWLVGMNATRAFTTKYYKRLSVGRVQTPTLAMLVERQQKINGFVKEAYYKVSLDCDGLVVSSGNIAEEKEADRIAALCNGKQAVLTGMEKNRKKNQPPKLYDLTTLQREANRFFGYTAAETLKELQELYEDKMVTYPRTDSQYITADMEETALELLDMVSEKLPFLADLEIGRNVGRIINNDKVSDHHALLPTKEAMQDDYETLSVKKRNLLLLIVQRLAQAVSDEFIYDETEITVLCEEQEFHARGRATVQNGFKDIENSFRLSVLKGKAEKEEADTPAIPDGLSEGKYFESVQAKKSKHFTSPPKAYSEDSLLSAMETAGNKEFEQETEKKGLGTPATRASIIEKLVTSQYAVRKGKQILPTEDGMALIEVMPDYLKSASMTAEWENRLLQMEHGEIDSGSFMDGITNLLTMMLNGCDLIPEQEQSRFHVRESIGSCPFCGKPVYEGKKNFYCSDRECSFALWKENRYLANMRKTMDKRMAVGLLKEGRVHVDDFYSAKKDQTFEADLLMQTDDGTVRFALEFPKRDFTKAKKKKSAKK
ncbi:MAG: DNA topoisomerase 3 [Lachnospiraceae bacterium]|nr:DNA topoisomerase 3 [Lachnospiraceae bacterium]